MLEGDHATVKSIVGENGIRDTGVRLVVPDDWRLDLGESLIRFSDFKKDLDAKGLTSS